MKSMDAAPNEEVIRETQDTLGKFVKRPPLTEKLLKKPPFRFLHDIITSVLHSNGFFEGLFEETELISENVKDREAKILFLNKVIAVLSITTGKTIAAKPSKIISGQEPEKTNQLLICLGQALEQHLSTSEAVKTYKLNSHTETVKNSHSNSINKPLSKPKESTADGNFRSKSNEKLVRHRDKKENVPLKRDTKKEKDKRDVSNSRDKQRGQRDNPIARKDTQKWKTEFVKDTKKERSIMKDAPITQQKPQDKLSKAPPPKAETKINSKVTEDGTYSADIKSVESNEKHLHNSNVVNTINDTNKNVPPESELNNQENMETDIESLQYTTNKQIISHTVSTMPQNYSNDNDENASASNHILEFFLQNSKNIQNDGLLSTNIAPAPVSISSENENAHTKQTSSQNSNKVQINKREENIKSPTQSPSQISTLKKGITEHVSKLDKSTIKSSTPVLPPHDSLQCPPSARPPSARPGAPRLRDRHEDVQAANEPVPIGKVKVIVENADTDAEEEDSLVFIQSEIEQQVGGKAETGEDTMIENAFGDYGHLVQQILESQKEFRRSQTGKTDIEWEFVEQRSREASNHEVEQLRFTLQALSRSANPTVKLLDHIHEDVEVMRQELQQWTKTYEDARTELTKEKSDTEQALQPLEAKIKQLDEEIIEKQEKIYDLKSVIHKNSMRINKLLGSGYVQ